jgi:hypothetical protein
LHLVLSAHLEYNLAEVAASFEVALRCPRFRQGKTPIDDHLKFSFFDEIEKIGQLAKVSWFCLEIVRDREAARLAPIGKSGRRVWDWTEGSPE